MLHLIDGRHNNIVAFVFVLNRFAKYASPSSAGGRRRALPLCNIIFINSKTNR